MLTPRGGWFERFKRDTVLPPPLAQRARVLSQRSDTAPLIGLCRTTTDLDAGVRAALAALRFRDERRRAAAARDRRARKAARDARAQHLVVGRAEEGGGVSLRRQIGESDLCGDGSAPHIARVGEHRWRRSSGRREGVRAWSQPRGALARTHTAEPTKPFPPNTTILPAMLVVRTVVRARPPDQI